VDQLFSRFSVALNATSATTLNQMLKILSGAFTPSPNFFSMDSVLDFAEWFAPHVFPSVTGHTESHQFVIQRIDRDDNLPMIDHSVRSRVQCSAWSNTPLARKTSVLMSLPTGDLKTKPGRPLFYSKEDADEGGTKAPEMMKACEKQINEIGVNYMWSDRKVREWEGILSSINASASRESMLYEGWIPSDKDWVKEVYPNWVKPVHGESQSLFHFPP
jgi:hypothetical protein